MDKHIRALKEERQNIDAFRTKCTIDMRAKEKLLLSYKLEIKRLRQYSGSSVTSSVLAGFMMQYKTVDYTKRIQTAFETCLEEVSVVIEPFVCASLWCASFCNVPCSLQCESGFDTTILYRIYSDYDNTLQDQFLLLNLRTKLHYNLHR